ncbi:hypothetical protein KCU62_g299, partial [Aureobasidium sp. EXF-3399]
MRRKRIPYRVCVNIQSENVTLIVRRLVTSMKTGVLSFLREIGEVIYSQPHGRSCRARQNHPDDALSANHKDKIIMKSLGRLSSDFRDRCLILEITQRCHKEPLKSFCGSAVRGTMWTRASLFFQPDYLCVAVSGCRGSRIKDRESRAEMQQSFLTEYAWSVERDAQH